MSTYNTTYSTAAPEVPARPITSTVTPDIVTSDNAAPIGSTGSFSTNVGPDAHVKSLPITAQDAPLVKPSSGIMHSIKKAFTTGSNVEMDPNIAHASDVLHANMDHTRELDNSLRRYQQAQQALQDAAVAVTTAFHHVLSDENNPYGALSAETLRSVQTHPLVPSHGSQLTDLTSSAVADMDDGMHTIEQEMRDRKTKQSDVEYYLAKVDKLSNTQEQNLTNNPSKVSQADADKLERNIGKAKEVQLEYNAENERLIANMNALWRRRIVRLGPALTGFIAQNQLVYQDQANSWQQVLSTSGSIQADEVHNRYLTDSSTVLVRPGSAVINHSAHLQSAHAIVNRRIEVEQQQRLLAENQQRVAAVQQTGGRLETVQQDVIVRSEEQMVWKKERFVTERVRLRKVVATEMVTITVPVRRERIEIDRIPVDGPGVLVSEEETAARLARRNQRRQQRASAASNSSTNTTNSNSNSYASSTGATNTLSNTAATNDIYDDEYDDEQFELVLCEERPRVVNDIVPVERIRMKKLTQQSTAHLEMDLRKEHIDFAAPDKQAAATLNAQHAGLVTQTGTLQTIEGQRHEGFTDTTQGKANVVVLPNMVASETATSTVRADVDDVAAMQSIGVNQGGQYGSVNTVGYAGQTQDLGTTSQLTGVSGATVTSSGDNVVAPTHPYYNSSSADLKATPDYATNETVNTTTTATTAAADEPVNRHNYV